MRKNYSGSYRDPRVNQEGYPDPTPYEAIKNDDDLARFNNLLNVIHSACRLAGFKLEEHVVLKDLSTGKIYR